MKNLRALFVLIVFTYTSVMPSQGWAQALGPKPNASLITAIGLMSKPGSPVSLSPGFDLAHFKGMVIDPKDPFKFDFIIHQGDEKLSIAQKQQEYTKLIKYFLAALAVPDTDQWVNLSPYEKDRIIADDFGKTTMGRDLLAQDYLLKQLSSSLTNPETNLGQQFWNQVYARVYQQFGTTNVPLNTFNKVWIVPDKAVIYEKGNMVYLISSHLKVMTEADYLAMKKHHQMQTSDEKSQAANISNQVMRQVILPAIEKEVNEGKNFAPLRQVLSGMILATWYKRALKESILGRLYANKGKLKGIDQDPRNDEKIYQDYLKAYKKGVYNMIREDTDPVTQEVIPRKYFSGGFFNAIVLNKAIVSGTEDEAMLDAAENGAQLDRVSTKLNNPAMRALKKTSRLIKPLIFTGAMTVAALKAHASQVTLTWKPSPDPSVNNYNLYEGTVSNSFNYEVSVGNVTNGIIDNLTPGTVYYFAATATFGANESAFSNIATYQAPWDVQLSASGVGTLPLTGIQAGDVVTVTSNNPLVSGTVNSTTGVLTISAPNQYINATLTLDDNGSIINVPVQNFPTPIFTLGVPAIITEGPATFKSVPVQAINGYPGASYQGQLQWSPDLTFANPVLIATFTCYGTNSTTVIDTTMNSSQQGFYRVKWLNPDTILTASVSHKTELMKALAYGTMKGGQKLILRPQSNLTWTPTLTAMKAKGRTTLAEMGPGINPVKWNKAHRSFNSARVSNKPRSSIDSAQLSTKGGIDFTQSNLDMQIKRDGKGIVLPVSQQSLDKIRIDGLVPVILDIKPVENTILFNQENESLN